VNPLQYADLSTQRRLLESRSAYATARVVVNIFFTIAAVGGLLGGFFEFRVLGEAIVNSSGPFTSGWLFVFRALICLLIPLYIALLYLGWVAARVFFDIADACLAISMQSSSEPEPSPPRPLPIENFQ
jgi:hypothetical protein